MANDNLQQKIQELVKKYHRVTIADIHYRLKKDGVSCSFDDVADILISNGLNSVLVDYNPCYPPGNYSVIYYISDDQYRIYSKT